MQTTTTELIARAAAAADMHDNFVTRTQWLAFANTENLALALFLARSGYTLNLKTETITVAGTEAGVFPLTADPLAIVAVHQTRDGFARPLNLVAAPDLHTSPQSGDPMDYRISWDQDNDRLVLNFYPTPSVGTTILVSYIPEPARLTANNSVYYPMGWEERMVLGMARRAVDKEESDSSAIRTQMAEMDRTIEEAVWNRQLAESPSVRNVDRDRRGWSTKIVYPSASLWWFR